MYYYTIIRNIFAFMNVARSKKRSRIKITYFLNESIQLF